MKRVAYYLSLLGFSVAVFLLAGSAEAATIRSVQRGEIAAPAAVNIAPVNPERAFVICYNRINHSEPHRFLCELEGGSVLRISTAATAQGTGVPSENIVGWQVVEFESGVRVQRGKIVHSPRYPGISNISIQSVDLSRSFVLINEGGNNRLGQESALHDNEWLVSAYLSGATNLRIQSGPVDLGSGQEKPIEVVWQVVEYDTASVQRGIFGERTLGFSFQPRPPVFDGPQANVSIAPTDSRSSFAFVTRRPVLKTGAEAHYQIAGILSGGNLLLSRLGDIVEMIVNWEVIQLGDGSAVQRGVTNAGVGEATLNVRISNVNPAESVVFITSNGGEKTNQPGYPTLPGQLFWSAVTLDDTSWTANLTSGANLQLRRSRSDTPSAVAWSVISFSEEPTVPPTVACTAEDLQSLRARVAEDSRCEFSSDIPAGTVATSTIPVVVDNPNDGPATGVTLDLSIPDGLTPVNISSNMAWDPVTRVLSVALGDFAGREEKEFDLTVEHAPGVCFMYGAIRGTFVTGAFCERRGPVVSNIESRFTPIQIIQQVVSTVTNFIDGLRGNDTVSNLLQNAGLPVAVTLGALGGATTAATAVSASAPFAWNLLELLRFLLLGFLRFKKHRPWGTVFDAFTKKPVAGAMVQIIDTEFQRVKETQISDQDGRFGFLVTPGDYYLRVSRAGYQKSETPVFHIKDPKEQINMDANLSPLAAKSLKKLQLRKVLSEIKQLLEVLNPYILIFGTALSALMFILFPTLLNYLVLMLYLILGSFRIWLSLSTVKSFGQVLDKSVHDPLPLSVVRVYDEKRNWLMGTRVTGPDGKFKFLLMPGSYSVSAEKENYQPFHSGTLDLKKPGVITRDIELRKS